MDETVTLPYGLEKRIRDHGNYILAQVFSPNPQEKPAPQSLSQFLLPVLAYQVLGGTSKRSHSSGEEARLADLGLPWLVLGRAIEKSVACRLVPWRASPSWLFGGAIW
jgi:hypothetical protein